MEVIDWLLEGDPAIRWQTLRDLTDRAPELAAARVRIPHEGLGAAILAHQAADGCWRKADEPDWLPTLFAALLLRSTGADPGAPLVAAAIDRLATGFHWHEELGGKAFFDGETEPCINGGALAVGATFGRPSASLARRLLDDQLADGGWNCSAPPSTCSSFHSTICVLEGLLAYERAVGATPELAEARRRGEAYLLERQMFRRRSTGEVAAPAFLQLAFPPRYAYDVVRGLDYLRDAGVPPDERVADAIRVLETRRQADGTWLLDLCHDEAFAFPIGERVGEPSRWNTLRALRVLRWARA